MFIIIIFFLINIIILFGKITIEIDNLKYISNNRNHYNRNYKISIRFLVLNTIPILKKEYDANKIEKTIRKLKLGKKINVDKALEKIKVNNNKKIKILKVIFNKMILIKKFDFELKVGADNAALTAIIIAFISSIISVLLNKYINNYNKQKYLVIPIYNQGNVFKFNISCLFEIKIFSIIKTLYILHKVDTYYLYNIKHNKGTWFLPLSERKVVIYE